MALDALVAAACEIVVNDRTLSVQWDLTRALRDRAGKAVLGICDVDPAEPGWAYVSIDGPTAERRPDLALSTVAHELGRLIFAAGGCDGVWQGEALCRLAEAQPSGPG